MKYLNDLVKVFEDTLEISRKFFKKPSSVYYQEKDMKIVWSDNTVESIFKEKGHIAALNFADDDEPGGLVWQGAQTQEECLCRCSNLYDALVGNEYYDNIGGLIYSKDVVFFRGSDYELREPRRCDIITCAAPVGIKEESKNLLTKMQMIVGAARLNGADVLILGKWGCGAFGGDWEVYKACWEKVLGVAVD